MNEFVTMPAGIDVDAIMRSIRERIEEKKRGGVLRQSEVDDIAAMELLPLPDFLDIPNVYQPHLYPGLNDSPLDHLPAKVPFEEPQVEVDESAPGARGLVKKIMGKTRKVLLPLIRFMSRPLYNELRRASVDNQGAIHHLTQDVRVMEYKQEFFGRVTMLSKEYIKLLHNTANNAIVEMTKAKIELEAQKTRIKVLEDRLEFVENRQRALEKKAFSA